MASLEARRKAGERFYVALVDPLLKKPAYYELRKPEVTVGFLPDCDWTLPWSSMSIDVLTDSRRYDLTYPDNQCRSATINSHARQPGRIGKREKEPIFKMKFDPQAGWAAECPAGHGCQVQRSQINPLEQFYVGGSHGGENNVVGTTTTTLDSGSTFQFIWPVLFLNRKRDAFKIPPQKLEFVFIACHEEEFGNVHRLREEAPDLLSLPKEVLAVIASYLDPREFLCGLAMVGRVFTSPAMEGRIPWKSLTLDASFDSLRIAQLASPESVRKVTCDAIWTRELRSAFYAKWKRVIHHEHLKILDLQDPELLALVGVPPCLEELRFRLETPNHDYWDTLNLLRFPSSIRRVCVRSVPLHGHVGREVSFVGNLSPKVLFSVFPGVTDFHFTDVGTNAVEWRDVPVSDLKKITSLFMNQPRFPHEIRFDQMSHLVVLQLKNACDRLVTGSFPNLEYAAFEMEDDRFFVTSFFLKAPKLRVLYARAKPVKRLPQVEFTLFPFSHPLLECMYMKGVRAKLQGVRKLLRKIPSLKDVEISAFSPYQSMSRSDFPPCPGGVLRWSWFDRNGDNGFDFTFSRITDEEREKVMKPLHREMFAWL